MSRSRKCLTVGISCWAIATFFCPQCVTAQGGFSAQGGFQTALGRSTTTLRQTREQIAALPSSKGNARTRVGFAPTAFSNSNFGQARPSFYRQASVPADVYPYPATSPPGTGVGTASNYALPRYNTNARLSNQMSLGSNTTTGNLGGRSYPHELPPVYNLTPNVATNRIANSRSPVEQQRSSTLPQAQQASLSGGGSNQSSRGFQSMQLTTQPTTAYRQSIYQQPTLGLGNPQIRAVQNCYCAPASNPAAQYNPTSAAYQAPSLNANVGQGLEVPPLNIQVPGQSGIAQPSYQPNYQVQPGVGTPQFGTQGASWWTPFVSGSGVYPPLVNFRNMPVGTYLGQGIIGQPTAYVDGQPVRNLLRYVFP